MPTTSSKRRKKEDNMKISIVKANAPEYIRTSALWDSRPCFASEDIATVETDVFFDNLDLKEILKSDNPLLSIKRAFNTLIAAKMEV